MCVHTNESDIYCTVGGSQLLAANVLGRSQKLVLVPLWYRSNRFKIFSGKGIRTLRMLTKGHGKCTVFMPAISDIWLALTLVQEAPECVASLLVEILAAKNREARIRGPTPWSRVRSGLYLKIGRNSGLLVQPGMVRFVRLFAANATPNPVPNSRMEKGSGALASKGVAMLNAPA